MSDHGSEEGLGENAGQVVEYSPPITALPPKVSLQEESQMEVSASPAFQCLDDLFQDGRLTGTKVAQLKAKYTQLHETLKSTRDSETKFLQETKEALAGLDQQKAELEKADNFPESSNSEVSKLREQLLKQSNELVQAEERQYQLDYKIECFEEEKRMLEKEYARMPKQGEIEKKMEELKSVCAELRKEIGQRQLESKTLKEEAEKKMRSIAQEAKEFETTTEELENLKSDLVAINTKPSQLAKESDRFQRQLK